jgi:outer membrane protein
VDERISDVCDIGTSKEHHMINMKSFLSLAVLSLVCIPRGLAHPGNPASSVPPIVLTLDKAIAMGLEQNRDMMIADQDRNKADAQVSEAWAGALPQLSIVGQYTRNIKLPVLFIGPNNAFNPGNSTLAFELGSSNSYVMGAQLTQPLYSRKVGVALDIADEYRTYTEEGHRATEQSVELQVKRAFYGVMLAQKLLEANRQGLEVVKANFENVQSLYRHGSAAEFDLLRAEVQLANTEPVVISAENALVLSTYALKNLLALPMDQDVIVEGNFIFDKIPPLEMKQARESALSSNPSITQLSLQESLLEKNITIESASYFPAVNLVGSYQWQSQDNTFHFKDYLWANSLSLGLTFSWTLFDGLRTHARVQQATVDRNKIHFLRLKAEEGLVIQIRAAELRMEEAMKRIEGQERNIDQAKQAVRIAQTRFKSGVGTQLELLDTQVAMTRAQTGYAQAIYDYVIARADWTYAVGPQR